MQIKRPVALIILDGYGQAPAGPYNAISLAKKPNLDRYFATYPHALLKTSGRAVGLPEGQMGNSEVGHTNMGAGRVVYHDSVRIEKAVEEDTLKDNPVLAEAMKRVVANQSALHIMGLVSRGGVHSQMDHIVPLLEMAKQAGVKSAYLHCFLDGRDVPPTAGANDLRELAATCARIGFGTIATVMGRYYAMDRDNRWERVSRAYAAITAGEGKAAQDAVAAVEQSYEAGVTDEFVEPIVLAGGGVIRPQDSVIFINFRSDRARELTRTLVDPSFSGFERPQGCICPYFVCMTEYDATMPNVQVAFPPQRSDNYFGSYISGLGKTQLRIAETEKYAHVTFFFNGGVETIDPGEDRCLIPSPKVATYDLKPEMSACEVAAEAEKRVRSGKYDAIILNFANCDMVGHTGVLEAAVAAVEAVDACVGQVADAILAVGGALIICADHGNSEQMREADGVTPFTAHTTNPVPIILCGMVGYGIADGALCDLAPTLLAMMGLPQPPQMTGKSLLIEGK